MIDQSFIELAAESPLSRAQIFSLAHAFTAAQREAPIKPNPMTAVFHEWLLDMNQYFQFCRLRANIVQKYLNRRVIDMPFEIDKETV